MDIVRDYPGEPLPEPIWILLKQETASGSGKVAVASAGPYANLHLIPER